MNLTQLENELVLTRTRFEQLIDDTADVIDLDNKKLKVALKTQVGLQVEWSALYRKASYYFDFSEHLLEDAAAVEITKSVTNGYKNTSITEAKEIAKTTPEYRDARRCYIRARALKDEIYGYVEAVESRKYILNNLTNAIVASAEDYLI